MSSSGFGQWYENRQSEESGGGNASSSWLGSGVDMLPLFNTESMPNVSFSSMKASMEAQMPKQIMGMGYQQRFKASGLHEASIIDTYETSPVQCVCAVGVYSFDSLLTQCA